MDRTAYLKHCLFVSLKKRLILALVLSVVALVALLSLNAGLLIAPLGAAMTLLFIVGWVLTSSYMRHRDDIELRHPSALSQLS